MNLGKSAKILVVDDFEEDREEVAQHLTASGHQVEFAEDGHQALAQANETNYDLILLDSNMPGMRGDDVLRKLKENMVTQRIPVIIVSGNEDQFYIGQCIQWGAEDYLPKPCNPILLNARVQASLRKKWMDDQKKEYLDKLQEERRRADGLLYTLFPESVANELRGLKGNERLSPRRFKNVAVMFCDVTGFTPYCERRDADEVVRQLQSLVESFEAISLKYGVEKIKTIGDAYMAAAGLLQAVESPVLNCIKCGIEMIEAARNQKIPWEITVGIDSGDVVGGVLGQRRFQFDIWGATVNTAARIQSLASPGSIDVSADAWQEVGNDCRGSSRMANVKGLGEIQIIRFGGLL